MSEQYDSFMNRRPTVDEYFLSMAVLAASRGTCRRRRVGCILVDNNNHIIGTGYNGVPRNHIHCLDEPCPGANLKSGEGLDLCYATHAEQNALLQCQNVENIQTCYTTTVMCVTCTKLLLNTGCQKIVALENYAQAVESKRLWMKSQKNIWEIANESTRNFVSTLVKLDTSKRVSEINRSKTPWPGCRDEGSKSNDDGSRRSSK